MKSRWEKLSLTKKKIFNILNQVNDSRISNQAYENWASEQILKIMFRNDGQFQMLLQSKSDLKSWLVKAEIRKRVFIGEQEEDDDAEKIILQTEDGQNVKGYPCTPCIVGT